MNEENKKLYSYIIAQTQYEFANFRNKVRVMFENSRATYDNFNDFLDPKKRKKVESYGEVAEALDQTFDQIALLLAEGLDKAIK